MRTDATLPRQPHRQMCGTSNPHHSTVGVAAARNRCRSGVQARRQQRRLAAPVVQVLRVEPGEERMVRHALEDAPEPVLLRAEPEPLLQRLRGLLEDDDPQAVAHAHDVGRRPVRGQGALADDQDVVSAQVGLRVHRLVRDAHCGRAVSPVSPFGSNSAILALNGAVLRRGMTLIGKESCWLSPVLNLTVAVNSYRPGARSARECRSSAGCAPARRSRTATCFAPASGPGRPSDQAQSHVTGSRELLMMISCLATVSPGRKLWSLLVNDFRLAADVGQQRHVVAQQRLGRRAWESSRTARRPSPCPCQPLRRCSPG